MSYIECNKCDSGYIDCFKCEGDGTITCPVCKGNGDLECRSCEGDGVYPDSGRPCKPCEATGRVDCRLCEGSCTVSCRKCDGSGKLTCRKCIGSGYVESPWETKTCEWREGCSSEISYHKDWTKIPTLCGYHIAEIKRLKAEREAAKAKWHVNRCANCPNEIRYHEDWSKVPEHCEECETWLTKSCAAQDDSLGQIRYKIYWDRIPEYCKACKSGERRVIKRQDRADGGWDEYEGNGYVNKNGVIIFTDDSWKGKHSHTVYNADGTLKGHRNEGYREEFKRDDILDKLCERCSVSFAYSVGKAANPPKYCKTCWQVVQEEREERDRRREGGNKTTISQCNKCGSEVEYPSHWSHPPNYCFICKAEFKRKISYKAETIRANSADSREQYNQDHIADGINELQEKGAAVVDAFAKIINILP